MQPVFLDGSLGVTIGSNQHANIEFYFLLPTQPPDPTVLEGAQKFGLQCHCHLGDLVQEQNTLVG